jgi:hypothetical protein
MLLGKVSPLRAIAAWVCALGLVGCGGVSSQGGAGAAGSGGLAGAGGSPALGGSGGLAAGGRDPACSDGVMDGTETSVDCGGACGICLGIGLPCDGGVCPWAYCNDGVQDGDETSVDCGPSCACNLVAGEACSSNAQCASALCVGSGNYSLNGTCQACPDGPWCESKVCVAGVCLAPTCSDGIANGDEPDVDCGGTQCAPCAASKHCLKATDCASGVCSQLPGDDCIYGSSQCFTCSE